MNWIILEELVNVDFSVVGFGVGSKLAVSLTNAKGEAANFEGICTSVKSRSPCKNYSVRKVYTDTYVERTFNYRVFVPKVQLKVKAKKKATLTRQHY
ncbi:MAG: 50S ribosomal protein L19 [Candidatus Hodgkinia cicadicola]